MKKKFLAGCTATLMLLALLLSACGANPAETLPAETTQQTEATQPTAPAVTWKTFPADRAPTAAQYFAYDLTAEAYLESSGVGTTRVYPASITKLFTAYTALVYLSADQVVTVDEAIEKAVSGSSVAGLQLGATVTVEQLIAAMLLPSGNDAAYVLAAEAGRAIAADPELSINQAVKRFVWCMNGLAKMEGMTGTHFVNPDGIHSEDHYSTFDDLVTMAKLTLEEPVIRRYAACSEMTLDQGTEEPLQWHNTNLLIDPTSEYYCPYTIGMKTGQTPSAGSCLLSAFQWGDTTLIVGVFGCPDEFSRFDDSLQLFNRSLGE